MEQERFVAQHQELVEGETAGDLAYECRQADNSRSDVINARFHAWHP
jgi:hypothetical protein